MRINARWMDKSTGKYDIMYYIDLDYDYIDVAMVVKNSHGLSSVNWITRKNSGVIHSKSKYRWTRGKSSINLVVQVQRPQYQTQWYLRLDKIDGGQSSYSYLSFLVILLHSTLNWFNGVCQHWRGCMPFLNMPIQGHFSLNICRHPYNLFTSYFDLPFHYTISVFCISFHSPHKHQ